MEVLGWVEKRCLTLFQLVHFWSSSILLKSYQKVLNPFHRDIPNAAFHGASAPKQHLALSLHGALELLLKSNIWSSSSVEWVYWCFVFQFAMLVYSTSSHGAFLPSTFINACVTGIFLPPFYPVHTKAYQRSITFFLLKKLTIEELHKNKYTLVTLVSEVYIF